MKMFKKKWVRIAGIALAAILIASVAVSGLFYWRVKHSILAEMGIHRALELEGIRLETWDQSYLPDGYYMYDPYIAFQKKGGEETECGIFGII